MWNHNSCGIIIHVESILSQPMTAVVVMWNQNPCGIKIFCMNFIQSNQRNLLSLVRLAQPPPPLPRKKRQTLRATFLEDPFSLLINTSTIVFACDKHSERANRRFLFLITIPWMSSVLVLLFSLCCYIYGRPLHES